MTLRGGEPHGRILETTVSHYLGLTPYHTASVPSAASAIMKKISRRVGLNVEPT